MNLIRKGHRHNHRGIIGIESAIVLIAFVIVAAALAFVVLNMGFATTQKAKTSIVATLAEAGSSLEISGKVFAFQDAPGAEDVLMIGIPIQVASGGESVLLDPAFTAVKYVDADVTYDDIYEGVSNGPYVSGETGLDGCILDTAMGTNVITTVAPHATTMACIYFTVDNNANNILDQGEHAVLAVVFDATDDPAALDRIKIELIPPSGATLTVERQIPNLSTSFVDLG